jgi:hypothetical protein
MTTGRPTPPNKWTALDIPCACGVRDGHNCWGTEPTESGHRVFHRSRVDEAAVLDFQFPNRTNPPKGWTR